VIFGFAITIPGCSIDDQDNRLKGKNFIGFSEAESLRIMDKLIELTEYYLKNLIFDFAHLEFIH